MKPRLLLTALALIAITAQAQTSSDYMRAMKKADVNIPFNVAAEGQEYRVSWGMDAAWDWDFNVYRGIAHIGKGNFATGRVSFQPNDLVTDNGDGTYTLTARQKKKLKARCDLIKLTGTTKVNLNCDHEALFYQVDANGNYPSENGKKITDYTGRTNYRGKPQEWYKLIKASVAYVQTQGLTVVSVSPFNEPDYVWEQATSENQAKIDFLAIAQLLKGDDYFKDIRICGGNTLNDDKALTWYNYLYDYIDEGNTHQLAGDFNHYADFFTKVKNDGKVATADELHNVGEAIVGVNYGMENGIWWGFDSKARGQFCIDSNEGVRIGYGENRSAWTNAAVYRNEVTGEVHGYLGSSERQATPSSFAFISTDKDVFINGYGPTRMYVYDVPGGTAYQKGQINAERLFDITWGEDVAPFEVNGTYQIMNVNSKKLLTMANGNATSDSRKTSGTTQQWNVYPSYTDGDISYWFIDNAGNTNMHLNSELDWGKLATIFTSNANVIVYGTGDDHPMEEQWYVKYAKNGAFYIINRLTNKYLYCSGTTAGTSVTSKTAPASNAMPTEINRYLWRFLPTDVKIPSTVLKAPQAPTSLTAKQRAASVELSWTAPTDEDVISYTILRAEAPSTEGVTAAYNTIGRNITATQFIDNTALEGTRYLYKVQAVDEHYNRSDASEPLEVALLTEKALLGQWQFDQNLNDNSANHLNATCAANPTYSEVGITKNYGYSGTHSLKLSSSNYAMIPYSVVHHDEMTIATWVRWTGGNSWQRIFDFGNSDQQYMFLCPFNGTEMRFVMKNRGEEQIIGTGKKLETGKWHHLAVTLKPIGDKVQVILYLDGQNVAESSTFTIRPTDIAPSLCYIGRSMFAADPMYNGYIDDFRIYNYALTAEEVADIMTDLEAQSKDISDDYEPAYPTAIHAVNADSQPTKGDGQAYDLSGRPASISATGVLIQGRKKIYSRP